MVKVLDFGLAKVAQRGSASDGGDPELSPTISMAATQAGVVLGTAAYMSPEQARGKVVDKRADIWAFGVVLYEMITGQKLFKGEDLTETLAFVVTKEPDLSAAPVELRPLLAKCLEKDPKKRLRDISGMDAMLELGRANAQHQAEARAAGEIQPPSNPIMARIPWALAGTLLAALIALAWAWYPRAPPAPAGVVRFTVDPPSGVDLSVSQRNASAWQIVSPDGRYVVFAGRSEGREQLWVRALGSLTAQRLDGTDGAMHPFWSPDSQTIAFFANGSLKKIPVSGGSPLTICDAPNGGGGTWNQDGVIVFAPDFPSGTFDSGAGALPPHQG